MWLKDTWSTVKNKTKNKPYKCCCHRAALACLIADLELSTCVSVWVGEGRIDWAEIEAGKSKSSCSVYKWMEVELAKLSSLTYLYCITEHNNIPYTVQFKQIQAMQTHYTTLRHLASIMAARAVLCVIEHFPGRPLDTGLPNPSTVTLSCVQFPRYPSVCLSPVFLSVTVALYHHPTLYVRSINLLNLFVSLV